MSHDIIGYNKVGKEIAYARFTMGDINAPVLYDLLNANEYNAGVSGSGRSVTFSLSTIEKALKDFHIVFGDEKTENDFLVWQQKEIFNFIKNCLVVAEKEEKVVVYFG